jgi:multidrug efflux pump subunit AcrB
MGLSTWSVKNRVAVNIFTLVVIFAGYYAAFTQLQRDLFPDVSTNYIQVTTLDPTTAAPEDIERTITVPLEEELANVRGLKKIRSISQDNFSNIFVEVDPSISDVQPVLNEVRQAVDKAKADLPRSAEPPVVEEFDIPFPLVTFTVSYPPGFDLKKIRPILDQIERRLKLVPGVSKVLVDGLERREVWVEIDPYRLRLAGLSFTEVMDAVAAKNVNVVGGRRDAAGGQRVVRLLGEITAAGQLEDLPVGRSNDGRSLKIRDLGTVKETSEKPQSYGRVNLYPAVTFTVVKKRGTDVIEAVRQARAIFTEEAAKFPGGIETQVIGDTTKYINTRIETVAKNGVQSLILVTAILLLFLDWRIALMVAFGIPFSFAGTFLVLYLGGYTINMLSLFGMIMALGMVVDDAVVSAENVYRHYTAGEDAVTAAIRGTREVMWPIFGSVSTTVAAFLPLIWGEGLIGKFLAIVPVVVISTLAFSLLQAFLVLPSHLADFLRPVRSSAERRTAAAAKPPSLWRRPAYEAGLAYEEMREAVDRVVSRIVEIYAHLLLLALRARYAVVSVFLAALIFVGGIVYAGVVPFRLFATDFSDAINIKVELPADYTLDQTADVAARIERAIVDRLPPTDLVAVLTRVGVLFDSSDEFLEYGTNLALIVVDVDEQNPECRKPSVIERELRDVLLDFPELVSGIAKKEEGGPPVGRALNIELSGPDFDSLRDAARATEDSLRDIPGLINVGNDFPRGKTELRLRLDEDRAARAGLDAAQVGRKLLGAFRGLEASRLRWGNDEVIVRVKMDERFSQDPDIVGNLLVQGPRGAVDVASIAEIEHVSGIARIKRLNQERVLTVSADIDPRITTSNEVNRLFRESLPALLAAHPGVNINLTGENEDTSRSLEAMKFAAFVALFLIYALLATITNSFLQPLVIMAVIPFGIVGVILGLLFSGQPMGLMSVMGTIALAGIVVNNSVVFVDFINRFRQGHRGSHGHVFTPADLQPAQKTLHRWTRWRSIIESGCTRFRPIFLTTATTVAGLFNLAFMSSGQEQFLAPMAQAIVWGLSFATLITLVLIPVLYSILDDLHHRLGRQPNPQTLPTRPADFPSSA